ncbi:MAG: hypothetical protein KDD60_02270 [Bdellovibrionales bacterium]|nr:hypothetical protein [Bdellovibrionales bacterium]
MSRKDKGITNSLKDQIEVRRSRIQSDSKDDCPEDFVPGLVAQVREDMELPEIDLSTPESAMRTQQLLSEKIEKFTINRSRIRALKQLLLEKQAKITEADPESFD